MLINKLDNVEVNLEDGHKYALRDIAKGENIIKYGNPIGHATADIKAGEHVHTHNVATNLSDNLSYTYKESAAAFPIAPTGRTFMGFLRENGEDAYDIGSIIDGKEAVRCGLIDRVGGLSDALTCLREMVEKRKKK